MRFIDAIGAKALSLVRYGAILAAFFYLSLKTLWLGRRLGQRDFVRQVLLQIYFTAVQAIGPVVALALAVGAFSVVEGLGSVGALSGAQNLGKMITVVVLREVAPLFTGVVVIARSVTAIAAELGVMRLQREIEALEVMGISPVRQLVTPRLVGGLLSLFGLSVLFAAVALLGGFMVAQPLMALPASVFFGGVFSATTPLDLGAFLVKILVGGVGLFLIPCYHGLDVKDAPSEVPVAVSRAALNALFFLVGLHGTVSLLVLLSSARASLVGSFL